MSEHDPHILIKKYFEEHSFIDEKLQEIINEVGDIVPSIIPPDVQDFRIKFDKIRVESPQIIEADGSKRDIFPIEARLRKLTYAAPIYLDVSVHIDGIQRESFEAQVGKMPIMLRSKHCHLYGMNQDDLIGPSQYTLKVFSQRGSYSIPHMIEQMKDGIIYLSFTRFKRIPILAVIKSLGLMKDQEIMQLICDEKEYDDMYINFYNIASLKTEEDAIELIAKKIGLTQPKEVRVQKAQEQID